MEYIQGHSQFLGLQGFLWEAKSEESWRETDHQSNDETQLDSRGDTGTTWFGKWNNQKVYFCWENLEYGYPKNWYNSSNVLVTRWRIVTKRLRRIWVDEIGIKSATSKDK